MQLDAITLYFCATIVAGCCALAMYQGWKVHRPEPAVRYWMIGFVLSAFGTLPIALGPLLPVWLARGVGNIVAVAGCAYLYVGTLLFLERPRRWGLLALVYLPAFVFNLYGATLVDSLPMRVMSYSAAAAFTCMLMSLELWRHPPPGQSGIAHFLAICWLVYAGAALLRGVSVLGLDPEMALQLGAVIQGLFFTTLLSCLILTMVGHLLLTGQRLQLRLDGLANRDELTGLLNRRAFQAQADAGEATLMVIDIDHFKKINDRYGHLAGDLVLRGVARTLRETLRPPDVLARAGGEEFWILAPRLTPGDALDMAERLRAAVEGAAVTLGGETIRVTLSIGLASLGDDNGNDLEDALAAADAAMYAAKEAGRNRVCASRMPAVGAAA